MTLLRSELMLTVFPTSLGWFGLLGDGQAVLRVVIGHTSAGTVRRKLASKITNERDWCPDVRSRLEDYAAGVVVDFDDVQLDLRGLTDFRLKVMGHVREIGYGRTQSYGEVAKEVGSPGAARAVGSVMAENPVPVLVPCHRVIASRGRLGGFSAPQGIRLKQRMLEMEANGE